MEETINDMKDIKGISFPDIDVSTPGMVRKSQRIATTGFQLDSLRTALQYITDWSVAIDGGAHIGTWSWVLSKHFQTVYAIELAPDTFECLEKNVKHWGIESNVITMNRAISNTRSSVGVVEDDVAKIPRSSGRHIGSGNNIQTLVLDDLNLSNLGFLKLDIEGHEANALDGARELLTRLRPVVLIENKPQLAARYGETSQAVHILNSLGAKLVCKAGQKEIDWIFAW